MDREDILKVLLRLPTSLASSDLHIRELAKSLVLDSYVSSEKFSREENDAIKYMRLGTISNSIENLLLKKSLKKIIGNVSTGSRIFEGLEKLDYTNIEYVFQRPQLDSSEIDKIGDYDLYLSVMLEFHYYPSSLRNLNIPKVAITSDLEVHLHRVPAIASWFDIIFCLDGTERRKFERYKDVVYENPFVIAADDDLLDSDWSQFRAYDVFNSGSLTHQINSHNYSNFRKLEDFGLKLAISSGYLKANVYKKFLLQSRAVFCPARNYGTVLSRSFDALSAGAVPIVPKGNYLANLFPEFTIEYEYDSFPDNMKELIDIKQKCIMQNKDVVRDLSSYKLREKFMRLINLALKADKLE